MAREYTHRGCTTGERTARLEPLKYVKRLGRSALDPLSFLFFSLGPSSIFHSLLAVRDRGRRSGSTNGNGRQVNRPARAPFPIDRDFYFSFIFYFFYFFDLPSSIAVKPDFEYRRASPAPSPRPGTPGAPRSLFRSTVKPRFIRGGGSTGRRISSVSRYFRSSTRVQHADENFMHVHPLNRRDDG